MMHLTDLQWQALASGGGLPRISLMPPPPSPTSLRSPDPQEDKGKAEQREDPDPVVAAAEIEGPELRQPRARRRPELRKERPRRWHRNQGSAANLLPVGPSRDYSPGDLDPRRRSLRRPCSNSPAAPAPRWPFRATEIQDTPEYIWSCVVAWHGITSLELFAAIAYHRQSLLLLPCWLLPPTMVLPCRRLVRVDRKGPLRKPRLLWLAEAKSLFALEGKECHQARTSLHELQMKLMRKAMHARILRRNLENLDVCRLGAFCKKVCWSISICSGRVSEREQRLAVLLKDLRDNFKIIQPEVHFWTGVGRVNGLILYFDGQEELKP